MKPLTYKGTENILVVIHPHDPISTCEMSVNGVIASYGFSVCKTGDQFSITLGMKKAFESALKRDSRIPKEFWVDMYRDYTIAFKDWFNKYQERYLKEVDRQLYKAISEHTFWELELKMPSHKLWELKYGA